MENFIKSSYANNDINQINDLHKKILLYNKFKKLFTENILINFEDSFEKKLILEFHFLCNFENLRILDLNKFKDFSNLNELKKSNKESTKSNINEMYENLLEEELIYDENNFCTNCQKLFKKMLKKEILEFPKYLIFNMSKNKSNINLNSKNKIKNIIGELIHEKNNKEFPIIIELRFDFDNDRSQRFELFCVINNNGDIMQGKYKMICKNFFNNDWYEYDEDNYRTIPENNIFMNKNIVFII